MKNNFFSRLAAFLAIVTLTFLLMKALPGDPFNEEQALPEEIHAALLSHYGLDLPWHIQYGRYLISVATWDFGPSFRYKDVTVNQIIAKGFPVSATLGLSALAIALCTGLVLGTIAALHYRRWQDNAALLIVTLGVSMPSFILATMLQYVIGLKLGWLPIARWGGFSHLILPALSLAALPSAFIARMVRSNLIEVLQQDYIKTARAKGVAEWQVVARHGLGNAMLPVLSYLGPLIANILVGSFVVEKIFAIPGLGHAFVNSVLNRDYTVIMGTTCFYSLILLAALFLVDLAYGWLDPRIKV
ncbi:MAG: ABC transporter permease [Parachlamydia sp.]|nr:ABC transporter permease [Parachlamydia sp.]